MKEGREGLDGDTNIETVDTLGEEVQVTIVPIYLPLGGVDSRSGQSTRRLIVCVCGGMYSLCMGKGNALAMRR